MEGAREAEKELDRLEGKTDQTAKSLDSMFQRTKLSGGWDAIKTGASSARQALNDLAEESGLTFKNLGLVGSAGAALGAGVAGWKIGRAVSEFFELDKAVEKASVSLLGFANVASETAAAKSDAVYFAIKRGASISISYTDAVKFNTQWLKNQKEGLEAAAEAQQTLSIEQLKAGGFLPEITKKIQEHVIPLHKLAADYHTSEEAIKRFSNQLDAQADAAKRAAKATQDAAEAAAKFRESVSSRSIDVFGGIAALNRRQTTVPSIASFDLGGAGLQELASRQFSFPGARVPTAPFNGFAPSPGFFSQFKGGVGDIFKSFTPTNIGLGLVSGGVSSLVNAGISGIGKLFGKLFDNPEKQVNPIREAFVQAAGGLGELNKRAHEAGVTLTALLDAKNPKQYEAAIRDLQKAFDFQDSAVQQLDDAVKRWGFSISELGPKLSQQKLDKQAMDLVRDFRLLEGAGVDVETISTHMADALNEYFHNAIKAGDTIPAAMKPILHQLAVMGKLTDENGDKIGPEGLEGAGVKFADTLDDKFTTLLDHIDDMIEAIGRMLGVTKDADKAIRDLPPIPNLPDLDVHGADLPGLATGTHGKYLNFGSGTPVMLHGRERVMTEGEDGGGWSGVHGLLTELTRQYRLLPKQLRDAVLMANA